jgi:hypothetical protein
MKMRTLLLVLVVSAMLSGMAPAGRANGTPPPNAWALHCAGQHDSKMNTCSYTVYNCLDQVQCSAQSGPARYDIYVIGVNLRAPVATTRYGLLCDGPFKFYGWTYCSDFQNKTAGWPGCGESIEQTWVVEQDAIFLTVGILDVYVYGGESEISICADQRVGYAEWCDGASPSPNCETVIHPIFFGSVGFGREGFNPCSADPVMQGSWGVIKSLFR